MLNGSFSILWNNPSGALGVDIQLTEFLTTTKLGLILLDPTRYMIMIKRVNYNTEKTFLSDIITYGKFEMQPEIRKVLDSLIKLNEEIKELKYLDFARIGEFISAYYKKYNEVEIRDLLRKADEFISNLPPG